MATSTAQRFAFPLPERSLPRIRVTPEQHDELRAFAVRMAHDVLRDGPTWGRTNVKAAQERGWKVSRKNADACFMMKTTPSAKPAKMTKSSFIQVLQTNGSYSQSSEDSPRTFHSNGSGNGSKPSNGNAQQHQQQRGVGGAGGRAFMGTVRLPGYTLDDVVTTLHCETTRAQRNQMTTSYGDAYLDCAVLQTLEGAKPHDPFWYLGIKWAALKSPFEKLVNHREFVYLEHSGTVMDGHGSRMLFRIIQSICLDDFGGEDAYFGLTRGHLEGAYVYWLDAPQRAMPSYQQHAENESEGMLTVCMKGLAHPKGKVPLWLVERYIKRFWKAGWSLQSADGHAPSKLQPKDVKSMTLNLATEWVADADRKACALCQKKFRFGRRMRHHCRACGEVICRACTQYFALSYAGSAGSLGSYGSDQGKSYTNSFRATKVQATRRSPFVIEDDDEDDAPATLGGNGNTSGSRRGRPCLASVNDAVMVGKVCRRCVEMKNVAVRQESTRISTVKKSGGPTRITAQLNSWDNGTGASAKPVQIHEADEHDSDNDGHAHDLPILMNDDESESEFSDAEATMHHQQNRHYVKGGGNQHHHDNDDMESESSIGDYESSRNFKPFATIELGNRKNSTDRIGTSLGSRFSQSGFSVGINDDDDDDGVVEYYSEPEPEFESVRQKDIHRLPHMVVPEEARFTMPKAPRSAPPPPPPQVAFNFVRNMNKKDDARLCLEDLVADTDDEDDGGGAGYSTSPPLRPSALEVSMRKDRKQPRLKRAESAPPLSQMAPPRREQARQSDISSLDDSMASVHIGNHYERYAQPSNNRDSNLSTLSFSSFDADILIDASALDDIRSGRMSFESINEADDEDALMARIQHIQDEVLRKQLLSSSESSVASSMTTSVGPGARYRGKRVPSATAQGSFPLSETSTISSNESFTGQAPPAYSDAFPPATTATTKPMLTRKSTNPMQLQVEAAIADQAYLLQCILKEQRN